jgi:hypothetical protein
MTPERADPVGCENRGVSDESWLNIDEVARVAADVGLEKQAVQAVAAGAIPHRRRRIGYERIFFVDTRIRVRRADLDAWLNEQPKT